MERSGDSDWALQLAQSSDHLSSWDGNDKLFIIGNGKSDLERSNTLVIYKNGNMTLDDRLTVTAWDTATNMVVCRNGNTLATCASSRRHKEEIERLSLGLETVA